MSKEQTVPLMLTVPKSIRDKLRSQAAKRTLENPDRVITAAQIATSILCKYINTINKKEGRNES